MPRAPKTSVKNLNDQIASAIKARSSGGAPGTGAGKSPLSHLLAPDAKGTGPANHQRGGGNSKFGQNKPGASAPRRTSG